MKPLATLNPRSPWESRHVEYLEEAPPTPLEVFEDDTRDILSKNSSPDVGFKYSVNPYRGCFHGCAYCYARPTHEYLGFGSGTDFERKIIVKRRAPELLARALQRKSWSGEPIAFSGNTDCYQPLEATFELTRACLTVCADHQNPVHVITKAPLIERDIDVLLRLAERNLVGVTVSVPFWDAEAARIIEPGVATPQRRMVTVKRLSEAGLAVNVNVAPVIPGLTDKDIPSILRAAAEAGAQSASYILMRLPGNVKSVFEARIRAGMPLTAEKILARTREARGGALNDPRFGSRMRGEGEYADTIAHLFELTARRHGLWEKGEVRMPNAARQKGEAAAAREAEPDRSKRGVPPAAKGQQLRLFE